MGFQCPTRLGIARIVLGNQVAPLRANKPGAVPFSYSWARTARGILQNARGNAPIAQTFERDLGLLAWYLANPRPTGHAALNLETESLGGRLGIGRNGKVDEIGHANLHVSNLVRELRALLRRARKANIERPA